MSSPQPHESSLHESSTDGSFGTPTPQPADAGDDVGERLAADVGALLDEVDDTRRAAGDTFDLDAITRQAELLERAHESLTSALDAVDRR